MILQAVFPRRNPAAHSPPALSVPGGGELPAEPSGRAKCTTMLSSHPHTACAPGVGQLLLPHREGSPGAADSALPGLCLAGDRAGKMR